MGTRDSVYCVGDGFNGGASAFAGQRAVINLDEMSLEELLTIKVTSAGKKNQLITETAAAIYVITADDIRRNNASTITELLRQVPGILVAREATGEWAISIRGFNDKHANKLLVLMDGRTLYSPLYAGVEWDVHDTMIEDIDRIEIIRGPGAALWGANAVNGVINIITKPAADTRGGLVTYQVGTFERSSIAARYGGSIGENGSVPAVLEVLQPAEPGGCRRKDPVWRMEQLSARRTAGLVADQDRSDHAERRVVAQQPPRG